MANEVGSSAHQGSTVYVKGLAEVIKKLRAAGSDLAELRELNHQVGNVVIGNAQVPRKSGQVAGTLRAGKGATKAVVRAGYASRGKYAGVLHYGDPHRGQRSHPFLTDALKRSQRQIISTYIDGIDRILINNNLK
ncbi:hypothetical protein JVX92_00705 [Microbacterium hominis]|uniref:hypothetical protein n=1 Tax=Microbacterium hominis TaxID=162426 RepID=UPI001965B419|nr:hypothetical protein [Microbacterium hominis]QRY40848.1 hypothetical protein JVX92_00705 [Microbacterium hominis]